MLNVRSNNNQFRLIFFSSQAAPNVLKCKGLFTPRISFGMDLGTILKRRGKRHSRLNRTMYIHDIYSRRQR